MPSLRDYLGAVLVGTRDLRPWLLHAVALRLPKDALGGGGDSAPLIRPSLGELLGVNMYAVDGVPR